MTITSLQTIFTGVNSTPRWIALTTDDSYATITTAGYLSNSITTGFSFNASDMVCAAYGSLTAPTLGFFNTNISNGIVTLAPIAREGEVTLPTIANHMIVSTDTVGTLANLTGIAINDGSLQAGRNTIAGSLISFPATTTTGSLSVTAVANSGNFANIISNASTAQATTWSLPDPGAATANVILSANAGTQHITAGALQIDAGALISGLATGGFVGKVQLFPTTSARGSLTWQAVANTGNTATIFQTAALGQATTYTVPDPATATANMIVAAAALVNNNLVKASGTTGLVVDAGARIISNTTGTYAGGGTSNTFAATGLTVAAKGSAVIRASTNSVSITKALPGTDTLAITFSADPGANTTVDYIYTTAAQS